MIPLTDIQLLLIGILAVSGLFAILQIINGVARQSYYAGRFIWLIDLIVASMYILVGYIVSILYVFSDYDSIILFYFLVIGVGIMLISFVHFCYKNKDTMKTNFIVIFLAYFLTLLYLTLFMRVGSTNTSVEIMPFDDFSRAFETGDLSLLRHMFMNVVLFIPFGYLIPAMNPKRLKKWSFSMLGGLILSTLIEGCQLTAQLGECDVDDIIANTVGSVIGYVLVRFIWRVRINWKI